MTQTTLAGLRGDVPSRVLLDRRRQRRDTTKALKSKHGIFTHLCRGGGDWMALSMPECIAAIGEYTLSNEEKTSGVSLMAGYCRLLDESGLIEQGHRTEYDAVKALADRLGSNAKLTCEGTSKPTTKENP